MPESPDSLLPKLGITTGDPAGIGPEVSLRASVNPEFQGRCRLLLFGDSGILTDEAGRLGIADRFTPVSLESVHGGGALPERGIVHVPAKREAITAGRGSAASGDAAARNILECARACGAGLLSAMVTAPLNKKYLQAAGYPYPGHTEFLAQIAGASRVAMAFLTERLKVVLATTHIPLCAVAAAITTDLLLEKLAILIEEFPRLGLPCRRVAVAGLNPHAGEEGLLGRDELERITPALDAARRLFPDIAIAGPLPADTLFYRAAQGEFDAVLALYHDQGLGPVKLLGFGEAVNVTLGLPFLRTSVDHGTAFEIAGKACARPESMISAIRWALRLKRGGGIRPVAAPAIEPRIR